MKRRVLLVSLFLVSSIGPASGAPPNECSTPGDTRCETWSTSWGHAGPEERGDFPGQVEDSVVAPSGRTLYVTGVITEDDGLGSDITTLAFEAHSGRRKWVRRYEGGRGEGDHFNWGRALALSPNGRRLYVAGYQNATNADADWAVLGYRTRDGKLLWSRAGSRGGAEAIDLVVSPDGRRVYVTGTAREEQDMMTIAFESRTGEVVWRQRHTSPHGIVRPSQIEVAPSGRQLFVLAGVQSESPRPALDTTVVTYSLYERRAEREWVAVTHATGSPFVEDQLVLSPSGDAVYVAATEAIQTSSELTKTVRLDAATGAVDWSAVETDIRWPLIEVDPDGSTVYIAGEYRVGDDGRSAATARNADSGELTWFTVSPDSRWSSIRDVGIDGTRDVFVAAGGRLKFEPGRGDGYTIDTSSDMITSAFDTGTGEARWLARSNYPDIAFGYRAGAQTVSVAADGWVYSAGDLTQMRTAVHEMIFVGYAPED